jgi:hypothetical protein
MLTRHGREVLRVCQRQYLGGRNVSGVLDGLRSYVE